MRFFLIDRIVEWKPGQRAAALKNVALSDEVFRDHFPRRPVFPGMLMIEGMAQLAGVLLEESLKLQGHAVKKAVITIIERCKFRGMVKPGDQLRYEAEVLSVNTAGAKAAVRALRDDRELISTRLTFGFKEVDDPDLERIRGEILALWLGELATDGAESPS